MESVDAILRSDASAGGDAGPSVLQPTAVSLQRPAGVPLVRTDTGSTDVLDDMVLAPNRARLVLRGPPATGTDGTRDLPAVGTAGMRAQSFPLSARIPIGSQGLIVGRKSTSGLCIPTKWKTASGTHCTLVDDGTWVHVQDQSTNGTWVQGVRLQRGASVRICHGNVVRIGPKGNAVRHLRYVLEVDRDAGEVDVGDDDDLAATQVVQDSSDDDAGGGMPPPPPVPRAHMPAARRRARGAGEGGGGDRPAKRRRQAASDEDSAGAAGGAADIATPIDDSPAAIETRRKAHKRAKRLRQKTKKKAKGAAQLQKDEATEAKRRLAEARGGAQVGRRTTKFEISAYAATLKAQRELERTARVGGGIKAQKQVVAAMQRKVNKLKKDDDTQAKRLERGQRREGKQRARKAQAQRKTGDQAQHRRAVKGAKQQRRGSQVRVDPSDGRQYTFSQFRDHYGGSAEWTAAGRSPARGRRRGGWGGHRGAGAGGDRAARRDRRRRTQ